MPSAEAEELKQEGNRLYARGEHLQAYHAYSKAMTRDPNNAILYANRAATSLARKQYLDTIADCQEAVKRDSTYYKAWARMATAFEGLFYWQASIAAWQSALRAMAPHISRGLTDAQTTMMHQFQTGCENAKQKAKEQSPYFDQPNECINTAPYDKKKLEALRFEKTAAVERSSVFPMSAALNDWLEATERMYRVANQRTTSGTGVQTVAAGRPALGHMCSALLCEDRVFHLPDRAVAPEIWFGKLEQQLRFENQARGGWGTTAISQDTLKSEILQRLNREGWSRLTNALGVTIRSWIVKAFVQSKVAEDLLKANEGYDRIIDLISWGRSQWPNVSNEQRGTAFESTFLWSVKRLKLWNQQQLILEREHQGHDISGLLLDIEETAQGLIDHIKAEPAPGITRMTEPSQWEAYWLKPESIAVFILGWLCWRKGKGIDGNFSPEEQKKQTSAAANYCKEAGGLLSEDDENYAYFHGMALDSLMDLETPLRETLPLCQKIRRSIPKVLQMWAEHANGQDMLLWENALSNFERNSSAAIEAGKVTLDNYVDMGGRLMMLRGDN